jgi:hypothetical protein
MGSMDGLKIVLDFIEKPAILFPVMRDTMKTKEFHAELVNIDINGKTWLKGEMIQVTSIDNCFEDSAE